MRKMAEDWGLAPQPAFTDPSDFQSAITLHDLIFQLDSLVAWDDCPALRPLSHLWERPESNLALVVLLHLIFAVWAESFELLLSHWNEFWFEQIHRLRAGVLPLHHITLSFSFTVIRHKLQATFATVCTNSCSTDLQSFGFTRPS